MARRWHEQGYRRGLKICPGNDALGGVDDGRYGATERALTCLVVWASLAVTGGGPRTDAQGRYGRFHIRQASLELGARYGGCQLNWFDMKE